MGGVIPNMVLGEKMKTAETCIKTIDTVDYILCAKCGCEIGEETKGTLVCGSSFHDIEYNGYVCQDDKTICSECNKKKVPIYFTEEELDLILEDMSDAHTRYIEKFGKCFPHPSSGEREYKEIKNRYQDILDKLYGIDKIEGDWL